MSHKKKRIDLRREVDYDSFQKALGIESENVSPEIKLKLPGDKKIPERETYREKRDKAGGLHPHLQVQLDAIRDKDWAEEDAKHMKWNQVTVKSPLHYPSQMKGVPRLPFGSGRPLNKKKR